MSQVFCPRVGQPLYLLGRGPSGQVSEDGDLGMPLAAALPQLLPHCLVGLGMASLPGSLKAGLCWPRGGNNSFWPGCSALVDL